MNETQCKKIVIGSFVCFLIMLFALSVVNSQSARRADTKIDSLERELSDARARVEECTRELEDCRGTVGECYSSVGRIADDLEYDATELSDIIRNLVTIRIEVENMENALSYFYDKYGYNDNDFNNKRSDIK